MALKWYGREALKMIDGRTRAGVEAAADFLAEKVREEISTPFPPASDPYMPPHLRSGVLRDSIGWVWNGDVVELGSTAEYAYFLELGTSKMAPRPFILPAILANLDGAAEVCGRAAVGE